MPVIVGKGPAGAVDGKADSDSDSDDSSDDDDDDDDADRSDAVLPSVNGKRERDGEEQQQGSNDSKIGRTT